MPTVRNGVPAKRRSARRKKAAATSSDWPAAARKWLKQHPAGSYADCRDAVPRAGHRGVSRKMVAEVARLSQALEKSKKLK